MRKQLPFFIFSFSLVAVAIVLAETLVVKIQATNLRKEPKFYSPAVTILHAGDTLEKVGSQNGWIQVKTSQGVSGWIHSSAVETKKFSLLALDKSLKTKASAQEVALASKGFNKQVEESYQAKHQEVSFVWVEKMLQIKIPLAQMEEFLKQGELGEFRGAK